MVVKRLHFNKPQLRSDIVGAQSETFVAGRGTGKTEGVLAPKSAKRYLGTMPRSTGVVIGATYNQVLVRTLPSLCAGWERLGYKRDVHYVVGRKPSPKWIKQWRWEGPYRAPFEYKYFISWWNSAGMHIISQDRPGSSNGITIDFIIGDEAKLLNEEKLKTELFPANRGLIPAFAGNPYHHGITFTTDMPVGTAGRWILDQVNSMDRDAVNRIFEIQTVRFQLRNLLKNETRKIFQAELQKQIDVLDEELNDLRRGLLYYHEASTLDNIHALGLDYIKQQLRDTSKFQFDTQILNLRPLKVEDAFYPDFDEEKHGYFAANNNYLDKLGFDFSQFDNINCLRDDIRYGGDLDLNKPLHVSWDANKRIHPLVFGQVYHDEIRALKGIHAMFPEKLKEALDKATTYYKPHKKKVINVWYDQTMVSEQRETRICDDVINHFRRHGWIVKPLYIGLQPSQESRYRMWGHVLTESGKYNKRFRTNRENCDKMILSMQQAKTELKKDGFGKDKDSEKDPNFPADESTHYTDAIDTLVYGVLESGLQYIGDTQQAGELGFILG